MNAYYVTHPYIKRIAVVHAPTTEKARTTFLDWLERGGLLPRARRQAYRRDMIAEKLEDPNVPSDVELYYEYGEAPLVPAPPSGEPEEVLRLGGEMVEAPIRREEEVWEGDEHEIGDYLKPTEEFREEEPRRMPIQEISLGGRE